MLSLVKQKKLDFSAKRGKKKVNNSLLCVSLCPRSRPTNNRRDGAHLSSRFLLGRALIPMNHEVTGDHTAVYGGNKMYPPAPSKPRC